MLDTSEDRRSRNLDENLTAFPYIKGELFKEPLRIPDFTEAMRNRLLEACDFFWADNSPAIFGSLFRSLMNKKQRRKLGAHYTTEKNILKVIGPLYRLGNIPPRTKPADEPKEPGISSLALPEATTLLGDLVHLLADFRVIGRPLAPHRLRIDTDQDAGSTLGDRLPSLGRFMRPLSGLQASYCCGPTMRRGISVPKPPSSPSGRT